MLLKNRLPIIGHGSHGLALSGGGARGFAHIGVLLAFDRFGIKPDVIAGVSAGSIATALYCSGLSPLDIFKCFVDANKFSDFCEWTLPRDGILKLDRFASMLESWLPVKYIEQTPVPSVICATDMDRGVPVAWTSGEIVPRVVASCSIPIVFSPVRIGGVNYVDGGVLRNLPAWAIRNRCKTLIGSNVSTFNADARYKKSIISIAMRSFYLMSRSNSAQDARLCDYVIQSPGLARFGTFELSAMRRIMRHGYDCACRILEKF